MTFSINNTQHYTECHVCILMLIAVVMSIVMLNAVMLNATKLNLIMLTVECLYQLPDSICHNNKMNILNVNFVHAKKLRVLYLEVKVPFVGLVADQSTTSMFLEPAVANKFCSTLPYLLFNIPFATQQTIKINFK